VGRGGRGTCGCSLAEKQSAAGARAQGEDVAGAIVAEWGVSENNRRARYYSITTRGRQRLRAETATWKRYVVAVSGVLETA